MQEFLIGTYKYKVGYKAKIKKKIRKYEGRCMKWVLRFFLLGFIIEQDVKSTGKVEERQNEIR